MNANLTCAYFGYLSWSMDCIAGMLCRLPVEARIGWPLSPTSPNTGHVSPQDIPLALNLFFSSLCLLLFWLCLQSHHNCACGSGDCFIQYAFRSPGQVRPVRWHGRAVAYHQPFTRTYPEFGLCLCSEVKERGWRGRCIVEIHCLLIAPLEV
jgi:hypothetical protein